MLEAELRARIEIKLRTAITERILREAGFEDQVTVAIAVVEKPAGSVIEEGTRRLFEQQADAEWRDYIEEIAEEEQ